jgi:hypothetical protein
LNEGDEVGFSLRGMESGGGSSVVWFQVHGGAELGPIALSPSEAEALGTLIDALTKLLSGAVESRRAEQSMRGSVTGQGAASRPSGVHWVRLTSREE